jgi:hypothetical protein
MLTVPRRLLTVPWVMAAQALSGIAKDLNKMSAKSSIKLLVPEGEQGKLYHWVAVLTGSKNALKGVGFLPGRRAAGGCRLQRRGAAHGGGAGAGVAGSLYRLKQDWARPRPKPKFRDMLSKSRAINRLSAARLFLFGARDVWFVVALPVYLSTVFGWSVSGRSAASWRLWVIGYGVVQSLRAA